jgi:hypothetical protein
MAHLYFCLIPLRAPEAMAALADSPLRFRFFSRVGDETIVSVMVPPGGYLHLVALWVRGVIWRTGSRRDLLCGSREAV